MTIPRKDKSVSLEEARRLALELLATLDAHEPTDGLTVRQVFEAYMDRHGIRCKSAKWMRRIFERHLKELAKRKAGDIKAAEVITLHMEIGNTTGRASANRALEVLRAAYNKAIKWGMYSGANPCYSVTMYPLETRDRYLSAKSEIDRFLASLAKMRSSTFRNFVLTSLFTAARVSNVMAMRWEELDLELGYWRIPDTKSGKPVLVPLLKEALEAIEGQRGKHKTWVFPGRGKTGHIVNPARAWKRLIDKAEISNLRMHDLRRTMGSWQANTGASLPVIQKTLGHSSLRSTYIYARLQLAPVRSAMQKAARAMLR